MAGRTSSRSSSASFSALPRDPSSELRATVRHDNYSVPTDRHFEHLTRYETRRIDEFQRTIFIWADFTGEAADTANHQLLVDVENICFRKFGGVMAHRREGLHLQLTTPNMNNDYHKQPSLMFGAYNSHKAWQNTSRDDWLACPVLHRGLAQFIRTLTVTYHASTPSRKPGTAWQQGSQYLTKSEQRALQQDAVAWNQFWRLHGYCFERLERLDFECPRLFDSTLSSYTLGYVTDEHAGWSTAQAPLRAPASTARTPFIRMLSARPSRRERLVFSKKLILTSWRADAEEQRDARARIPVRLGPPKKSEADTFWKQTRSFAKNSRRRNKMQQRAGVAGPGGRAQQSAARPRKDWSAAPATGARRQPTREAWKKNPYGRAV